MEYKQLFLDPEMLLREGDAVTGALDLVERAQDGGEVAVLTDDTRLSSRNLLKRLEAERFEVSGVLTGADLVDHGFEREEALVIGGSGLLEDVDVTSTPKANDIILGYDKDFSYRKIRRSERILREDGDLHVCSRRRMTCLIGRRPHQSPLNAALSEFAEPKLLGFPSENAVEAVRNRFSFVPDVTLLVSDRLDMVEAGNRLGVDTAVLADKDIQKRLREARAIRRPNYALSSLHSLNRKLF